MIRNAKWCLVALSSVGLFGFTDNGCFGDLPGETEPASEQGCWVLGEEACLAAPACAAVYDQVQVDCACAPCMEGADCGCDCGMEPTSFSHCQPGQVECGPICDIWCEYGNVIDDNGCPTCACNPYPTPCEGLDERACSTTPGCLPIYGGYGSGGACGCPGCDATTGECPPCECDREEPAMPQPDNGYAGCITQDPCASLSEEACANTPGCFAEYGSSGGACPPCTPDGVCPGCTEYQEGFLGCHVDWSQPECWSDYDCGPGARCDFSMTGSGGAGGGASDCACACDPDGFCGPCDCGAPMPAGGICVRAEPECWSDADCGPGFLCIAYGSGEAPPETCACDCDPNGGDCACNCIAPAPGGICVPADGCSYDEECGPGGHCWDGACYHDPACSSDLDCPNGSCWDGLCVQEYCSSDAECPGGYCSYESGGCGGTGGGDCPALVAGSCVYPSCDDGQPTLCDMMPPACPEGQLAAARNGCYECVDARSCAPVDPPDCIQVITYAADPASGACFAFSTPCDVPAGWGPCAR